MTPDLERIEALAKAATAGPWDVAAGPEVWADIYTVCECDPNMKRAQKNAEFIAALNPQTALALVARVRELEKVEKAAQFLHDCSDRYYGTDGETAFYHVSPQSMSQLKSALDGAKGEAHGPQCHICHGKGWLNTADQNALEDGAKGGNVVS